MLIPVRCFTCNKVIGNKWELYQEKLKQGKSNDQVFKELGLTRYCCKRMLMTHVDFIDQLLEYHTPSNN